MYYPAPYYIETEIKQYKYGKNNSIYTPSGNPKSIRPNYPCYLQEYGTYSLLLLDGAVTITKEVLGVLQDTFTATFAVPVGTLEEDIRIYFTPSDGNYVGDPEFNQHLYEIRPVEITITAGVATLFAPAYLFKKPTLDELTTCACHVTGTYVDEIAVYSVAQNACNQGVFVSYGLPCGEPCEITRTGACIIKRTVGDQIYGMFYSDILTSVPREVEYNYLTGVPALSGGYMDVAHIPVISMLAIGLSDCLKGFSDWCCDGCMNEKISYYKTAPKALIELSSSSSSQDKKWEMMLTQKMLNVLNGLPPANGIVQALRFINRNACDRVEGTYFNG
jgi:hypothetical protein